MANEVSNEVLNNIRSIRDRQGIKLDNVAMELNMSTSNYSKIERGEVVMTLEVLVKLPAILKVTINEFFGNIPDLAHEDRPDYQLPASKKDLVDLKHELIAEIRHLRSSGDHETKN